MIRAILWGAVVAAAVTGICYALALAYCRYRDQPRLGCHRCGKRHPWDYRYLDETSNRLVRGGYAPRPPCHIQWDNPAFFFFDLGPTAKWPRFPTGGA